MNDKHVPPDWAFEFHGHRCPFMPIGYRMGILALALLGAEREKDHGLYVVAELGEGHPQTCMMDGIQVATGATYGKLLLERSFLGKLAATFSHRGIGGVRLSLKADFVDAMGKFGFFAYRKQGKEPSEIPEDVAQEVIEWVYSQSDDDMFAVERKPDFRYSPVKGSFSRTRCSECGEYVFERYVRTKDGKPVCIPCSGYGK